MVNNYVTIGPIPVQFVSDVMRQLEDQSWEVRHMAFAGMVDMTTAALTLHKPPPQPSFAIVCCKEFIEGRKIEVPKIKIAGRTLENNN